MEIKTIAGDITRTRAGAIVVGLLQGKRRLEGPLAGIDRALDGAVSRLMRRGVIKGKPKEVTLIDSLGKLPAERVAVVGLGKRRDLTPDKVNQSVAEACRFLQRGNAGNIAVTPLGAGIAGITAETAAQAISEGALLGLYTFRKHVTKKPENGEIKRLSIVGANKAEVALLEQGSQKGIILAEAANLARDMVNEPANYETPTLMAETATEIAKRYGLEIEVLGREQMQEQGMGALLGVAQGSEQPPKFIILRYKGSESADIDLLLAGKAITFDSGGISIKPSEGMGDMKGDMAGGAAVIAAMGAIARLRPRINVTALVPATENLPSGKATRPGDILTAMNGKTIEIISTDAEGRLILADALSYAATFKARRIVDVATLTGACMVALGKVCSGAFANNQDLANRVIAAGNEVGERIWQMPMFEEYKEQIKSDVADIKNVGGRYGGAITAALFLAEFVGETPWVHLDIAGTNMTDKEQGYQVKGATGVPVRTLVNLVLSLAAPQKTKRRTRR